MTDQKNTILAIVLSAVVLIGWQYFFAHAADGEAAQQIAQQQQAQQQAQPRSRPGPGHAGPAPTPPAAPSAPPARHRPAAPSAPAAPPSTAMTRDAALAASPRIAIDTPSIKGSIALKGGRIDDLALVKYRETVDPKSPPIVLLSPSGSRRSVLRRVRLGRRHGTTPRSPTPDTVWTQQGSGALDVDKPVTLHLGQRRGPDLPPHDRGRRQISLHPQGRGRRTAGTAPVTLLPLCAGLAPRHAADARLLHPARRPDRRSRRQGPAGNHLLEHRRRRRRSSFDTTNALARHHRQILGGDAAARHRRAPQGALLRRHGRQQPQTYQTDYLLDARTIAPGATATADARLFAGAKEVAHHRRLREAAQARPLRPADRLGLVLLHHQADVLC